MRLRAPFPWFGGKSRAAPMIWEAFGADVANYVEPFAGSLAVLLGRPTPGAETVNDKDAYLANFWRALRAAPDEVAHYADWPVSEADLHARHLWLVSQSDFRERMLTDPDYCDAKIAGWWVWGLSAWIGSGWCSLTAGGGSGQLARSQPQGEASIAAAPAPHWQRNRRPSRQLPAIGGGANRGVQAFAPTPDGRAGNPRREARGFL